LATIETSPAPAGALVGTPARARGRVQRALLPLRLRGATARVRGKTLLGPVDLTIARGGTTIVLGPNGSGKTTLLRVMHGLQRLSAGSMTWNLPAPLARERQAYVFQTPIMMRRSVLDNLAYPLLLHGMSRREARKRAACWAERVGLGAAARRPAPVLSGGEKQKLALARALIRAPEIVFLDEPCANLDGNATREIEALLADARAAGTRIVMATHDLGQARRLASDVLFLRGGLLHESAPADRFFDAPDTAEATAFLRGDIVQ